MSSIDLAPIVVQRPSAFRRAMAYVVDLLRRRPWLALGVYWVMAFVVTHLPPIFEKDDTPGFEPPIGPDKVVHFFGFAALAFLLMNTLRRLSTPVAVGLTLLLCAIYGVFDELTQPPFARTADPWDWVADMVGAIVGITFFLRVRLRLSRTSNDGHESSGAPRVL